MSEQQLAVISRVEVETESEYARAQGRRTFEYRLDIPATQERIATLTIVQLPTFDPDTPVGSETDMLYANIYHIAKEKGYKVIDMLYGEMAARARKNIRAAEAAVVS